MGRDTIIALLDSWPHLNKRLASLSAVEVGELLAHEMRTRKRRVYVVRLHGRAAALRTRAERTALLKEVGREEDKRKKARGKGRSEVTL